MSANREQRAARLREMMSAPSRRNWFEGKDFTEDWSSAFFPAWESVLGARAGEPLEILEIGSFEGRSAIFWLEFFPKSRLTCIDHFATTKWREGADIERRFDANLAPYKARLTKIKSRSAAGLSRLAEEGKTFDLVYIDGSHYRDAVLADSLLAWPLVRARGFVIFDDYLHDLERDPAERPKDGIDCFLKLHEGEFEELARGYQLIIRRK